MAHRGGRFWTASNFSYIDEARESGADIVELDVRARGTELIVQHDMRSSYQGVLRDALARCEGADVFLDVKDRGVDIWRLLDLVKLSNVHSFIVGSFYASVLRPLVGGGTTLAFSHIGIPAPIPPAVASGATWLSVPCWRFTPGLVQKCREQNIKLSPWGNFQKNASERSQLRCAMLGAHSIATYDVRHLREIMKQQGILS